jgi:hypothetical protein
MEFGEWHVTVDEDGDIALSFEVITDDGVQAWCVVMPTDCAIEFAEAVLSISHEVEACDD